MKQKLFLAVLSPRHRHFLEDLSRTSGLSMSGVLRFLITKEIARQQLAVRREPKNRQESTR
jgi:hypothetical protein